MNTVIINFKLIVLTLRNFIDYNGNHKERIYSIHTKGNETNQNTIWQKINETNKAVKIVRINKKTFKTYQKNF